MSSVSEWGHPRNVRTHVSGFPESLCTAPPATYPFQSGPLLAAPAQVSLSPHTLPPQVTLTRAPCPFRVNQGPGLLLSDPTPRGHPSPPLAHNYAGSPSAQAALPPAPRPLEGHFRPRPLP